MKRCNNCQKELKLPDAPGPTALCPYCQADLRACFNCRRYSPDARFQCLLPREDEIKDKKRVNACPAFLFREFQDQFKPAPQEAAKKKLDDLFRNF